MYILNYILLVAGVLFLLAMFFICFGMFHTPRKKAEPEQFVSSPPKMIRTGRHIVDADDDDETAEDQDLSEGDGDDVRAADGKDIDEHSDTNDRNNSDSSSDAEDIDDADNNLVEKETDDANVSKTAEAADSDNKKVKKNENLKSRDVAVIITFIDSNKRKNIVVEDEILIGRSPKCDVVINNSMVSAAHCALIRDGEKLMAEDNNSTNGTMLNGKPLHHAVELKNNDVLTLGNKSIRINFS